MVFVDSDDEEEGSDCDDYYHGAPDRRGRKSADGSVDDLRVDGRDSGYLTTTDVTDTGGETAKSRNSSAEQPPSLKLHPELNGGGGSGVDGGGGKKGEPGGEGGEGEPKFIDEVHQKNVDELRTMKEFLELHIAKINYELLEQLEIRDYLDTNDEGAEKTEAAATAATDNGETPAPAKTPSKETETLKNGNGENVGETNPASTAADIKTKTTKGEVEVCPSLNPDTEPPDPDKCLTTEATDAFGPCRSRAPKRKSFWWR